MRWQKPARLVIAAAAVVFAVGVALTLRTRTAPAIEAPLARTDPKAKVESAGGLTFRVNKDREEVRIRYDKLLTYENGSSKMVGVTVTTERAGGRVFTISGQKGEVTDKESNIALIGDVRISATDGMELRTERAALHRSRRHGPRARAGGVRPRPHERVGRRLDLRQESEHPDDRRSRGGSHRGRRCRARQHRDSLRQPGVRAKREGAAFRSRDESRARRRSDRSRYCGRASERRRAAAGGGGAARPLTDHRNQGCGRRASGA